MTTVQTAEGVFMSLPFYVGIDQNRTEYVRYNWIGWMEELWLLLIG